MAKYKSSNSANCLPVSKKDSYYERQGKKVVFGGKKVVFQILFAGFKLSSSPQQQQVRAQQNLSLLQLLAFVRLSIAATATWAKCTAPIHAAVPFAAVDMNMKLS